MPKSTKSKIMKRSRSRKGAPGIIEVARRAKVSPATVSRFFNTPEIVRQPTRKRIEQAAADLGYIRDRMAGTLHHGYSGTIGLVVPTIDNAIFAELIEAFSARLREHDRTMLIAAHGYDLTIEVSIIRSLLERRIDGVALIGLDHETAALEMLSVRNVPALVVWNYRADSPVACIGADNEEAGYRITRHVIDKGHRSIALLFPAIDKNDRAQDRLKGALSAISDHNGKTVHHTLIEAHYDIGHAKQTVCDLLASQRPTALVCGNDIIAHGAVYACQKLGLKIPEDISVIGIGDFRGSAHMEPPLTTLRLPARQIGTQAADMLCSGILDTQRAQNQRILIPTKLQDRSSVKNLQPSILRY